ncbi:MAG: BON domain-containing protein [Planctomycetota bacterium]|nr:BON domain-containing protein [Planctomycetota bacterium]MDA1164167.1 BON domain-containing protein [Planctomycetota bacterium]
MSPSPPHSDFAEDPSPEDRELESSVRNNLQLTGYHQLRRIDVVVEGGRVRLSGRLPKFYLLQLAQQAAMNTEGVVNLDNNIEVVRG